MSGELVFKSIYEDFHRKIYRYLARIIGFKEAEDLTQEVFIKGNQSLDTFKYESQLSTWIYRIATNTAIDKLRSRSFKQAALEEALDKSSEEPTTKMMLYDKRHLSLDDQIIKNEMNACIRGYVTDLPANYRVILVLSELEGLSNAEIGKILGLSIDVVKIRLHRARKKLKSTLTTACNFYRTECNTLACEQKKTSCKA